MFWRKKTEVPDSTQALYALAAQLGVEKRFSPRVSYPPTSRAGLPTFRFGDHALKVHDLSMGGCSLFDPDEIFGAEIGLEYKLTLEWGDARDEVNSRLVGRVDRRRNFQFLNLPAIRGERIRDRIAPGVRGSSLNLLKDEGAEGPTLAAIEVWTSPGGDSVAIESIGAENQTERVASIYLAGKTMTVVRGDLPRDDQDRPISRAELDAAILFLANAPQRSTALVQLLSLLEQVAEDAPR